MTLKYERQWEIVDKLILDREKYILPIPWKEERAIVEHVFKLERHVDTEEFWTMFENTLSVLRIGDWETKQKPLLDKMIELMLMEGVR